MPPKLTIRIARQRLQLTAAQRFVLWTVGFLVTSMLRAWLRRW
jgi:nitrate/nitrite transporter NarK